MLLFKLFPSRFVSPRFNLFQTRSFAFLSASFSWKNILSQTFMIFPSIFYLETSNPCVWTIIDIRMKQKPLRVFLAWKKKVSSDWLSSVLVSREPIKARAGIRLEFAFETIRLLLRRGRRIVVSELSMGPLCYPPKVVPRSDWKNERVPSML